MNHRNEEGATAAEYAIVAAAVAAVITASVAVLGGQVHALFHQEDLSTALTSASEG